jgi:hypothetical protein
MGGVCGDSGDLSLPWFWLGHDNIDLPGSTPIQLTLFSNTIRYIPFCYGKRP